MKKLSVPVVAALALVLAACGVSGKITLKSTSDPACKAPKSYAFHVDTGSKSEVACVDQKTFDTYNNGDQYP